MKQDVRYQHVKSIWMSGDLKSFSKIFEIVPKSVVAADLGLHYNSFIRRMSRPDQFLLVDMVGLSDLTGIPIPALIELAIKGIDPAPSA